MMQEDIKNIFLAPEEFGEEHIIEGNPMIIIIDSNELLEREKKTKILAEGLHTKRLLFYVAAEEYGELPSVDRILELDGEYYKVIEAINENGIYSISLEANEE